MHLRIARGHFRLLLAAAVCCLATWTLLQADERDRLPVGVQPDGRIVVPTNQVLRPAGTQVSFPGRPVDLLLIDDGRTLVVKNRMDLVFLDTGTGTIKQTLRSPGQGKAQTGFSVVGLARAGNRIY